MTVAPRAIVEHFDVIKQIGLRFVARVRDPLSDSFFLQAAEKGLRGVSFGHECLSGPFIYNCDALMSDLYQIELDLGSLVVDDDGTPSVSIDGPDEASSGLLCEWTANGSGGSGTLTYTWSGLYTGTGSEIDGLVGSSGWINVQVEDFFGRTGSAALYFTAGSGSPPECSI